MQPFCKATTLLSVFVRRWLLRMSEASTLTLVNLSVSGFKGLSILCDLRANIVHNNRDSQAMLAAEDMLQQRCLAGAL